LELFRNHPELAPLLLRQSLHVALPEYTSAQIVESTLIDIQPVEYRADLVVLLHHGIPVYGIVVEAQLQKESNKLYSWPAYAALLRSRERCPVCVLVFAGDETVADWARRPIDLGGGNSYTPWVISPLGVPIITNEQEAKADPELAVLSAMAHGADNDHNLAVSIALAAQCASVGLDADRSKMYCDLILNSLTETARQALMNMNPANYQYQSEFAKRYVAEGKVEGKAEGRCELLIKQLTLRFGVLPDAAHAQIQRASVAEIDAMGERVLSAQTLEEVMGSH
jgi:hypothetical protein